MSSEYSILENRLAELVSVDNKIKRDFEASLQIFGNIMKKIKDKKELTDFANKMKNPISKVYREFRGQILKLRRIIVDLQKIVDYKIIGEDKSGNDTRLKQLKYALKSTSKKEVKEHLEREIKLLEKMPSIRKHIKERIAPKLAEVKEQTQKTLENANEFIKDCSKFIVKEQDVKDKLLLWELNEELAKKYVKMMDNVSILLRYWENVLGTELSLESKLYPTLTKIELTNTTRLIDRMKRAKTSLNNNIKRMVNSRNTILSFLVIRTVAYYLHSYSYQVVQRGSHTVYNVFDKDPKEVTVPTIYKGDLIPIPGTNWTLRDIADASITASYIGSFIFLAVMTGYVLKIGKYAIKKLK